MNAYDHPLSADLLISTRQLTKRFGKKLAVNIDTSRVFRGSVYGLVGPNGAGKSTYLRLLAGVYKPDSGLCQIDNEPIWEHPAAKQRILFLPDQPAFLKHASLKEMQKIYRQLYPNFNSAIYLELLQTFQLNENVPLKTFSKGMQRQAALCLVIACRPDLLLLDEAFDGLDPVMRQVLKKIIIRLVSEHNLSVVISSHNLRELEDLCDFVGLMHEGRILIEQDLDDLKLGINRVQVAWEDPTAIQELSQLNIVSQSRRGSIYDLVIKGRQEDIIKQIRLTTPLLLDILPLSLEEIFIQTMEVNGYDIQHIFS